MWGVSGIDAAWCVCVPPVRRVTVCCATRIYVVMPVEKRRPPRYEHKIWACQCLYTLMCSWKKTRIFLTASKWKTWHWLMRWYISSKEASMQWQLDGFSVLPCGVMFRKEKLECGKSYKMFKSLLANVLKSRPAWCKHKHYGLGIGSSMTKMQ